MCKKSGEVVSSAIQHSPSLSVRYKNNTNKSIQKKKPLPVYTEKTKQIFKDPKPGRDVETNI